jgi:hypothetical protein
MIRRDYILRMIEEFFQALSKIRSLKKNHEWKTAAESTDKEFQRLIGVDGQTASQLSETELLARVVRGEATLAVREKTLMLATLLKEAGDVWSEQGRQTESRTSYLKGMHLLLDVLARGEVFECPEFVPKVEEFVIVLAESLLPLETYARLMQHYERTGEFAKAEDALFVMLDAEPENGPLLELGVSFYQRIKTQSDTQLADGNLPRMEVEAGLADLNARKDALCRTV